MTKKIINSVALLLLFVMSGLTLTSCGPENVKETLVGRWRATEVYTYGNTTETIKMELTFNKNKTGSIVENWITESRASSNNTYRMDFSWSTTTDSSGNTILKVSYVDGDKNTEIFNGSSTTVLWSRQYVITGKILNIYGGDGVWVFNKE